MDDSTLKIVEQLVQQAEALMLQVEFAPPESREVLFHEVKDVLIGAEKVIPGSGAWLMACIHGRQNNPEMCLKWLNRGKKHESLPDKTTIQTTPHLKPFYGTDWFHEFLKG